MLKKIALVLTAVAATCGTTVAPSLALPILPSNDASSLVIQVANGCGVNRYRGPYGSCHRYGTGPYPGGYRGPYRVARGNGCPPGFWRGPWGHCRDTPYHGRLPGGGWK